MDTVFNLIVILIVSVSVLVGGGIFTSAVWPKGDLGENLSVLQILGAGGLSLLLIGLSFAAMISDSL